MCKLQLSNNLKVQHKKRKSRTLNFTINIFLKSQIKTIHLPLNDDVHDANSTVAHDDFSSSVYSMYSIHHSYVRSLRDCKSPQPHQQDRLVVVLVELPTNRQVMVVPIRQHQTIVAAVQQQQHVVLVSVAMKAQSPSDDWLAMMSELRSVVTKEIKKKHVSFVLLWLVK